MRGFLLLALVSALVQRSWTPEHFGTHLIDLWTRTLLDPTVAEVCDPQAES